MTPADCFPDYLISPADQSEMAFWCLIELRTWRQLHTEYAASRDPALLPVLELAYAVLRTAYCAALSYADAQDAAARTALTSSTPTAA